MSPVHVTKPGFLYVLTHPSDPNLYKVGVTTRKPEQRLVEHNRNFEECAGLIVKETGKPWELKTSIAVPDTSWAESVFWSATPWADIPFLSGIEIHQLEPKTLEAALEKVRKAGVRPPKPVPDWVYAYSAWMNQRLEGRDIVLIGQVRSKAGRASFRCGNGHEWRTEPRLVAEGEGCPDCGLGTRTAEEIWQASKSGYVVLLVHPDQPGAIRVELTKGNQDEWHEDTGWADWQVHRYRYVDESDLAENVIWQLLKCARPAAGEPLLMDLGEAEQAFRDLIYRMREEIALREQQPKDRASA